MNKDFLIAYSKLLSSINSIKKETENPFFKSKYADLNAIFDEVKSKIEENGFVLLQTVEESILRTKIVHIETGEMLESRFCLITQKPDMQQLGSAVTYARRYSLLPMLNIECEDDDGNGACGKQPQEKKFDELETLGDFVKAICSAQNEKQLCALWYKYRDRFGATDNEYKDLNKLSSNRKHQILNPDLKVDIFSGVEELKSFLKK